MLLTVVAVACWVRWVSADDPTFVYGVGIAGDPNDWAYGIDIAADGLAGNMKDALSSHGVVDVDLATVLIEDMAYDEREWASACPNVFTKSSPPLPVARGVLCLLYARGNLYALPAVDLWGAPNEYIPDIQWLLKRLGAAPS